MPQSSAASSVAVRSWGRWLALTAALLGWLFDGAEMGVFSLIGRPALRDLLGASNEEQIGLWFGTVTALFLVGAATGGVLFGWLGDRIGRVRAMTLSVLTYALFTGACGLAHSAQQLACLRSIASLGMGGEWSLGVALVMELWPDDSRAWLAGIIGAAANVGYLLIALLGLILIRFIENVAHGLTAIGISQPWVDQLTGNQAWRLLILAGVAPALLAVFIQLLVPESEKWQQEQQRGATAHWALRDLLGVVGGAISALFIIYLWAEQNLSLMIRIVGTVAGLVISALGYMYPVVRFIQRSNVRESQGKLQLYSTLRRMLLAAALSGVALLGTWASLQWAPTWVDQLTHGQMPAAKSWTQVCASVGAIFGTLLTGLLASWFSRKATYRMMCLLSFGSILLLYQGNHVYGPMLLASVFIAGGCTAMFYGWLPLYLPELFPTILRATGQGFGFNYGRILAAIGALQTGNFMLLFNSGYAQACSVMSAIYLLGIVLIAFAPETSGQVLCD